MVVADDFVLNPQDLIDHAVSQSRFGPDPNSAYPGVRMPLPKSYVFSVLDAIHPLLFKVYDVPANLGLQPLNAVFSLVTQAPEALAVNQRMPHFDSPSPFHLALLHYLAPGPFGGTGLFRHRPTGFERIGVDRVDIYQQSRDAYLAHHGEPGTGYPTADSGQFKGQYEMYDQFAYRPNRLVIYPGSLLHTGLIDPSRDANADPRTGRLTANLFVDFT